MTDLLNSIKADLLDRRLLPIVALVGACLVAAIAYAVLGGSGGSSTPGAVASTAPAPAGLSVDATTPETAVAETPDGVKEQHGGHAHDPFSALPGAAAAAAKATPGTSSTSGGSSSGASGSSGESTSKTEETSTSGSKGTEETKKSGSSKKTKSKAYDVAIEFGVLPAGTTPQNAQLTPYEALKLQAPLPSASQALLVFRGVTSKGKSATFTLVGEAILHGVGACLPSASQCQALDLKPGDTEQLEYLQPNGESIVYELRVISISAAKGASAASVKGKWAESKAGVELLSHRGLAALPFLRYSSVPGVLVFPQHGAFSSRAHASWRHRRR
jgi:hypothetical protein